MVKRKKKRIIWIGTILVLIILGLLFFKTIKNGLSVVGGLLFSKNIELRKTSDNINILMLGIGGGKHDGPDLSDTIMVVNIKPTKNEVNIISLPRDLWISDINSKINTAYALGEEKGNKGILLSKAVVQKIVGKDINYVGVVNFSGFVQFVDILGGVDVNIQRGFNDYAYPIDGKENDLCGQKEEDIPRLSTASSELEAFPCRYKSLSFKKGLIHMNGITALSYVRSRHAVGPEGTDFARSARQQQVILALKDKMFSLGTIFNPIKVLGIYNVLKENINTNIDSTEFDDFIRLAQKMKQAKITNYVVDTGDLINNRFGLLDNPSVSKEFGGQWVLIPRKGKDDFTEIKKYVDCILTGIRCEVTESTIQEVKPSVSPTSGKNKS